MNTVDALLELAIMLAVFSYVIGLVVPPLREDLRRWSFVLIGIVFGTAILIVGMRAHPVAFTVAFASMSVAAYAALQIRRGHRGSGHSRATPTPFLNLRVTGKTVVERDEIAGHDDHEDVEEHP
jgi:hypothetical protein